MEEVNQEQEQVAENKETEVVNTAVGLKKKKRNTGEYIKITSIVLYVIAVIGAFFTADVEVISGYSSVNTFDGNAFITMFLTATVSCLLMYGIGELVDHAIQQTSLLKKLIDK